MVPPDNKAMTSVLSEYVDFMGLYAQTNGGVVRDNIPDIGVLYNLHLPAVCGLHKVVGGDAEEYAASHNGMPSLPSRLMMNSSGRMDTFTAWPSSALRERFSMGTL